MFEKNTLCSTVTASERVFSLLESMFGKDQISSLADLIQGALRVRSCCATISAVLAST